jgi:hypothetical protein
MGGKRTLADAVTLASPRRIRSRMTGVPVTVSPPTKEGRLYPRYHRKILTLRSALHGPWPYAVNIDGTVILDFDENRTLAAVELLLPMSGWKGKEGVAQPLGRPGDIRLAEELSGNVQYDWPIVVSKDVQRDMARISFGSADFNRAVTLSDNASALLQDVQLTGFWFSLAR